MADKPESLRATRVSRRTQVIRRAATDDARRHGVESGRLPPASPARSAAPSARDAASARNTAVIHKDAKVVSGRVVGTDRDGVRASVRLRRGDTLVQYKSGETLIRRRVAPKTTARRNILIAYAIGYAILFGAYAVFLFTGTYEMDAAAYLDKAFARRHGETVVALQRAAVEATRGNRTPAEVRFAKEVSFYDRDQDLITIGAGSRVTLLTAAKLGEAVIADLVKPEVNRSFSAPFVLYREDWLAGVDWPYWLMLYNLIGFYLLLALFLWKPISNYLGLQGSKTAAAIENARTAQDQAEQLRDGYRQLSADLETKRQEMEAALAESAAVEHRSAIDSAKLHALEISGGVASAMEAETNKALAQLKESIVVAACQRAGKMLAERVTPEDHDRAVNALIADIEGMNLA